MKRRDAEKADGRDSEQRQLLQILSILEDEGEALRENKVIEAKVELEEIEDDRFFVKRGRKVDPLLLSASSALDASLVSSPSGIDEGFASKVKGFLFKTPYRVGRVFTASGNSSGTGWISTVPYVMTCAHVVTKAGPERLLFQLPDNVTVISVAVVFSMDEAEYTNHYKRDIAILKMESVLGSNSSIAALPLQGLDAGLLDWTCKCATVGILPPVCSSSPKETQKMVNCGTVESESSVLTTTSARADKGFSGGPLLNQAMQVIGMIQGDHGEVIKTVKIIPVEDISFLCSVLSQVNRGVPPIPIPMRVSGSSSF